MKKIVLNGVELTGLESQKWNEFLSELERLSEQFPLEGEEIENE